jgi:hypothetical protein
MTSPTKAKETGFDAEGASTDNELTVVHLTTPMTLAAGTIMRVTCSSDIELVPQVASLGQPEPYYLLSAATPITVTTATETIMSPSANLGHSFALGWAKLPTELKLHVLKTSLVADQNIGFYSSWVNRQGLFFQHLAMGGEIAALAQELFYSENTFELSLIDNRIKLPPRNVRSTIKHLCILIGFHRNDWDLLRRLANNSMGFTDLKSLDIHFGQGVDPYSFSSELMEVSSFKPVPLTFKCAGHVTFAPKSMKKSLNRPSYRNQGYTVERVEVIVKRSITFTG